MAFADTDRGNHEFDVEAQHHVSPPPEREMGGSGAYEASSPPGQSGTSSDPGQQPWPMITQDVNPEAPSVTISQDEGYRGSRIARASKTNVNHSGDDDGSRHASERAGQDEFQADPPSPQPPVAPVPTDPPVDIAPGGNPERQPEEKRIIGDFNGGANALWTLYGKEAKSHDEAQIETLKDDMEGVLIFAGLFSAVLTAFIIDSKQGLKVSPTDQMVYYLQQNVAMLDQISRQIFAVAPQVSIPSTPPAEFPAFKPSSSDMRVNVFWFMALVFSLFAALLATLVQQWVRNYMHVFQRYSDPLKSARLRQYLHEGSKNWYMHPVAEAVPALLHVSLFLFFVGLCDFVLNINTTIGLSTTIPIAITASLYIFTTIAPIINPQSPYQNSFSSLIWYVIREFGGRRYQDRDSHGASKSVSSNMAERQMQLAMGTTVERMGRDERAIRWLVSNMTEDAETESFVMAVPGSFDGPWGEDVWNDVLKTDEKSASQKHPSRIQNYICSIVSLVRTCTASQPPQHQPNSNSHSLARNQREDTMSDLGKRVVHLLETCKHQSLFASHELWRRRTRACVETTSLLFGHTGVMPLQFGDMLQMLGDLGRSEKIRELSLEGRDGSLVLHWTCLSLIAIKPVLESVGYLARDYLEFLGRKEDLLTGEVQTVTVGQKITDSFEKALGCLNELVSAVIQGPSNTGEGTIRILRNQISQISELERIDMGFNQLDGIDFLVREIQDRLDKITCGISHQLPGIQLDISDTESVQFSQFADWFCNRASFVFLYPGRNFKRIRTAAHMFRDVLAENESADTNDEMFKNIRTFYSKPSWWDNPFRRQEWRMQDLTDGGGLGFIVEFFFLSVKQLIKTSSEESHSVRSYIATFRVITSDWREYKDSLGTQKLLLSMVVPHRGTIFDFAYPREIVTAFLEFLGNVLEGQTGEHIDDVAEQLDNVTREVDIHPRLRELVTTALQSMPARASSP